MIRFLALVTITTAALFGQQSALDIMKRSIELEARNRQRAKDYTYQFVESTTEAGSSTRTKGYDVLALYGRPYTRLIAKDGKPLSESEQRKQESRLQKEMDKRKREAENPNGSERRDYEKQRAEARRFLNEIPRAFDFRIAGEENVSGKPAWVIQAEPKPGYQPSFSRAGMLSKLHGRIWVDKAEYQWVKLDAETTDTISFGLFLARLARGSTFRFEQRRVNGEVWLPAHVEIAIDGRLALVKRVRAGVDITYSNYRKFQTDSKIVSTATVP